MRRANTYTAHATDEWQQECLCEWLAACCAFHNQVNYRRRQAQFDTGSWRTAEYTDLYPEYAPVISKAACQQLVQKNAEAWRSFDRLTDQYHEDANSSVTDRPSPPGYWGSRSDGYELKSVVRQDLYELTWRSDDSTIEIPVGKALNDTYDIPGRGYRVTLELRGNPRWKGTDSRLDIQFDDDSQCFRVTHPVVVQPEYLELRRERDFTTTLSRENAEHSESTSAAIDVGANNTLSIVTEGGDVLVFQARPEFRRFQTQYEAISELQSELPTGVSSSKRIRGAFAQMYGQRDHHRDAAVKRAAQWLLEHDVNTVYVGDLSGVLNRHWSARVNRKTHNFWSHGQLTDQLEDTLEVVNIDLVAVSERETSSTCPHCGSEAVTRSGDDFSCDRCHVESHADVVGAALILSENADVSVWEWFGDGSMARPAAPSAGRDGDGHRHTVTYLQWNDHEWTPQVTATSGTLGSFDQRGFGEPGRSLGRQSGCVAPQGIPRLSSCGGSQSSNISKQECDTQSRRSVATPAVGANTPRFRWTYPGGSPSTATVSGSSATGGAVIVG